MSLLAQHGAMLRAAQAQAGTSTDFSEYPLGLQPADWTPRWATSGVTYSVQEFAGSKVLRAEIASSGRHVISWNAAGGEIVDVEVLAKVRFEAGLALNETGPRTVVRGGGSATEEEGYAVQLREHATSGFSDTSEIMRVASGSFSRLGAANLNVQPGSWYWLRLRVEGAAVRSKCWPDGTGEPDEWEIEASDESLESGWIGFGAQTSGTYYCGFFSFNAEGGSAPTPL